MVERRAGADSPSLAACVHEAAARLTASGVPGVLEAEVLARHLLGWDAATWIVRQREPASSWFQDALDRTVERRQRREPVAYITGRREFFGREFLVTPDVLIPRPETELVVETVLGILQPLDRPAAIADVGTGSGCVGLTIAAERPGTSIYATDVSTGALAVAARNAAALGVRDAVDFVQTSLVGGAEDRFDVVASNPPYVSLQDREDLEADVRDFEPSVALFGGADGLDVIRALAPAARRALVPEGSLVMELGAGQADRVRAILTSAGLAVVRFVPDLAGIPRVAVARRSAAPV